MKRNNYVTMVLAVAIVFFVTFYVYAWEVSVPESRRVDWTNAGLLPNRTISATYKITIEPGQLNSDQDIESAINTARTIAIEGGYTIIFFPAGDYYLIEPIEITAADSNIVFQGEGSDLTTLHFCKDEDFLNELFMIQGSELGYHSLHNYVDVLLKGTDRIQGDWTAWGIEAGDWVHFTQWNFDYHSNHTLGEKEIGQITQIISINGNEATVKDKMSKDYNDNEYEIVVEKIVPATNIGIENLKIHSYPAFASDNFSNIIFNRAVNCWVRAVELENTPSSHIKIYNSSHIEISGCYIHHAKQYTGDGTWAYGVLLANSTTNCLIENNIFKHLRHSIALNAGANCNVVSYNYSTDQNSLDCVADLNFHAKYSYANLLEQNFVEWITADNYHGDNGPYNTIFRNFITDPKILYVYNQDIVIWQGDYFNVIGNMRTGQIPAYIGEYDGTSNTLDRFGIFQGNYENHAYIRNLYDVARYNTILLDQSFYYTSKPDFLPDNYPWPSIGPRDDNYMLPQIIPALTRYDETLKTYLPQDKLTPYIPPYSTPTGTMGDNTTWNGDILITGDIIVPAGVTLTILPGTRVRFAGLYEIKVYGTINATGTEANKIIFRLDPNAFDDRWKYIHIYVGSNIFQHCIFEYGYYPIYMYSCTTGEGNPNHFEDCTFRDNIAYGFRSNYSVAEVVRCEFMDNGLYGIRSYSSDIDFTGNFIHDNSFYGVYSATSNMLNFYGNVIENNEDCGFYTANADHIHLGEPYSWYGYNTIRENNGDEIYAASGNPNVEMNYSSIHDDSDLEVYNYSTNSRIYTQNCYWGSNGCQSSGSIYLDNAHNSLPNWDGEIFTGGPLSKISESGPVNSEDFLIDPSLPKEEQFKKGKEIIASSPTKKEAVEALDILYRIVRADNIKNELGERDSFKLYLETLRVSHAEKGIGKRALRYLILWNILGRNNDEVITLSEKALDLLDQEDTGYVIGDLAYIYLRKGLPEKAKTCLESLQKRSDMEANFCSQLKEDIQDTENDILKGFILPEVELPNTSNNSQSVEFGLLQNYPNPSNPTTTIQFNILEAQHVTLKIYNILGEEIATLIDGQKEAGAYTCMWEGKNQKGLRVSSGIYLYRLTVGDRVFTKKMMLLQ